MASDIALGIVIGGAVSATFGRAITKTSSRIVGLRKTANETRLWQRTIGETVKLQDEFRRLHAAGDRAADGIRRKIESNLRTLRDNGIEVDRLDRAYTRLGRTVRGLELKASGQERIAAGREGARGAIGDAVKFSAAVAVPATISADYQAIIRDIAIKAGIARSAQEASMGERIRRDARDNGIGRNELADAVNQMVAGGMDVSRALDFAPLAAKFSIGQAATTVETARMIQALQQNAKITDPKQMEKALEAIAFLGKEGSFESADMARWFPVLLAEMQKIGITGQDSVTQLGAMLQVQMKTAGNADEAANNLKNWFSKIGSNETASNYKKAGVDYEAKMREAIGKGWSTLEASFVLARAYIERTDPAKAKQLADAAKGINGESDPDKRRAQIAAFEDTMKTGDLFNDMQVKAALTAYLQNADLYQKLKKESSQASGEIAKDLADRRDASKQIWSEVGQQWNDAMRSIGDALRPVTDAVGSATKTAGQGLAKITDAAPKATMAVAGVAASLIAYRGAKSLFQIGRGALDIARGSILVARGGARGVKGGGAVGPVGRAMEALGGAAASAGVQRVFVVNLPGGGIGGGLGGAAGAVADELAATGKGGSVGKTAARGGRFARVFGAARGVLGRVMPYAGKLALAGTVLKFGLAANNAYALATGDDTRAAKAQGFAGIAGSLAGGMLGAKVGAMIGAFGGPIGAAVGGLAGGALGTFAGEKALGSIAKLVFSRNDAQQPAVAEALAKAKALERAPGSDKPVAKIDQQNTFAPVFHVTFQGEPGSDAADRFLAKVSPQLQRLMKDELAKNNRSAMFDSPHL
ncbi:phage tail tape measure protein [Paraburkholderia sp. SEWSISQ10-3 4]|uniref:phage tail tape measure protein n=1 Tax=Paraburkholderia TaxID=1822464 RepID=UPI00225A0143|nr:MULTISPECIES: phage tail tape measure protein [Paraburkholderia]MCX4139354.1 phage tail tape measure protein [Paraburkholderia aspalathi]MDN7172042.1 phage tail tape measure protein [Paraburkholderia sp. SEWSISQ10-3 4]MDQ6501681.1 phage tail tape measure protein [Paraburkholderia aspalathi]